MTTPVKRLRLLSLCVVLSFGAAQGGLISVTGFRNSPPPAGAGALAWNASTNATGYLVCWNDAAVPGPPYTNCSDVGNVTTASPVGFNVGEPARIRAYDESTYNGPWSSEINTPSCTTTISTGANVPTTVSGAANGSTICFNNGNYGNVTLNNIVKTSNVTLKAVNTGSAQIDVTISGGTRRIRMDGFVHHGIAISGSTTRDITIFNFALDDLSVINTNGFSSNAILFSTGTANDIDTNASSFEGRIQMTGSPSGDSGVQFEMMEIARGCADGFQDNSEGNDYGPGLYFHDIRQDCGFISPEPHVDPIQMVGGTNSRIYGNFILNNSTSLEWPDSTGGGHTIEDNIIYDVDGEHPLDLGTQPSTTWRHNTVRNIDIRIGGINQSGTGSGSFTNGVMHNAEYQGGLVSTCNSPTCTYDTNLFTVSGDQKGTHVTVATPTYDGGTTPSTWAGWKLANGSAGENAATDGFDLGSRYHYPAAPTNFRQP